MTTNKINRDDYEPLDVLMFNKWEVDYLYNLVMQDYLLSNAGEKEDLNNQLVRARLALIKSAYETLSKYVELVKRRMEL